MRPTCEKNQLDLILAEAGPAPEDVLALGAWLRRFLPPDEAARAAEQVSLRRRARGRFERADELWLTAGGLEQSTHPDVARARAARFAELAAPGSVPVHDATCGLGFESAVLVQGGFDVLASDRDEATAGCARHNLGVWLGAVSVGTGSPDNAPENLFDGAARGPRGAPSGKLLGALVADVLAPPVARTWRHLLVVDPSRRPRGERTLRSEDWSPPWRALAARLGQVAGACVKLAPAARPEELESALPAELARHWQWTSRRGELAELCLWTGVLARPSADGVGGREACLLGSDGATFGRHLGPGARARDATPLADPLSARWLAVPDPALVASGLLGPVGASVGFAPLGSSLAFMGGERPANTPGLRDLAVRASCKLDRKVVRRMLAEHDIGRVQVLARGLAEPADELAARLSGPGSERGLLVAARGDSGRFAWLVEEVGRKPGGAGAAAGSHE